MAREYWYMQLRRWLMRSSVKSVIRSSLSGQKRVLKPSKPGAEGRCERAYRNRRPVTKSACSLSLVPTGASGHSPSLPCFAAATPIGSTGDLPRVRGREAGRLRFGKVSRGLRVRRVDAAEDDEIAGRQSGEVLRIEDADGGEPLRERPLRDLDGGRAAAVLRHRGEDERVAVGQRPVAQRRRGRAGRRRRCRRRGGGRWWGVGAGGGERGGGGGG